MHTAISLVGYEKEIEAAMKFVFGSSFVCTNMEHAKKVGVHDSFGEGVKRNLNEPSRQLNCKLISSL